MWKSGVGSWESLGKLRQKYVDLGAERGYMGYPAGSYICKANETKCYQKYEGGYLIFSTSTGTWDNRGKIRERYAAIGAENGIQGYPTSGEICNKRECYQKFENGQIIYDKQTREAWESNGKIRNAYDRYGLQQGYLGYPRSGIGCTSKGCYQKFEGGYILLSKSTGAWENRGNIRKAYAKYGYEHGKLGYPTSDEECSTSAGIKTCRQTYQRGYIDYNFSTKKTRVTLN